MHLRHLLVACAIVAPVVASPAHAASWFPKKGRPGVTTQQIVVGNWDYGSASVRVPRIVVQRAPRGTQPQQICITRRLWVYGGNAYEPLRDWQIEWRQRNCANVPLFYQAEFEALVRTTYFYAYHFDYVVTWRNARTRQVIASGRWDYDIPGDYRCGSTGRVQGCSVGRYYRNVAGILFTF